MELKIRMIRHGLTVSNEEHRYLGLTEETLSERGRALLQESVGRNCGGRGREQGADKEADKEAVPENMVTTEPVFVSPMRRCRETAEILFPAREKICIPEWTEIDFGDFEGKNFEELKYEPLYQEWMASGGKLPFPNGESRENFITRCMQGYERMVRWVTVYAEKTSLREVEVTAVVNGGTIMAVCSSLFGGDYFDYQIRCGGEYICPSVII